MTDMLLFITAFVYFWAVMFDRHPRQCAILGGVILIGTAGTVMQPPDHAEFYRTIAASALSVLLVTRAWQLWKE